MLNKALRTQDIEIIIKMGSFVCDIHRQIEQLHSASDNRRPLTVYRGQGMLNSEFQKIRKSKGGLLSFNNFLSTSIDQQVSLVFAKMAQHNPDWTPILFRMEIDPALTSTPFAELNNISYYSDLEKEVLFSMHTVFRIGEIEQIENGLWQVELTLTSEIDEQLKRLTERIKTEIGPGTGWHRLSQLMIKMGKFDKAKEISQTLLDSASDGDARTIAACHHQLGYVNDEKGDLKNALFHYRQSLDISLTYLSPDDPSLASTYSNIGSIYKKQDNLDAALEHFQRALSIDLHVSHPDQLQIATHYNNIGLVLKRQDKYDEALKNYERALEIKLAHLPPRHPSLATAYSNISGIYQSRKDYSKALSFLEKTLEIKQKSLPPHHPSLIVTHRNMATAFEGLRQYEEAVQHAQHAVDIARRAFETDHSEVKENQDYLDELRRKL
jgi:tetratricopeptide (TPR) repeat protein